MISLGHLTKITELCYIRHFMVPCYPPPITTIYVNVYIVDKTYENFS